MSKTKMCSLYIGIEKLRVLKQRQYGAVSHKCSKSWENFVLRGYKIVRFHDQRLGEEAIFEVKSAQIINQLGERIVRIEVSKLIL